MTELTDIRLTRGKEFAVSAYPLTLLYEETCPLCKLEIDNLKARNGAGLLRFVDVSAPDFDPVPYGVPLADLLEAIHAVKADGGMVKGVGVFRLAYAAVGLGWITRPTGWPLLKPLFDRGYVHLARNRHRISEKFAWLLFGIAAKRAERRSRACKDGNCAV
jgi:predicted DCC family thiol-disulfide oxidoreductase YuxK